MNVSVSKVLGPKFKLVERWSGQEYLMFEVLEARDPARVNREITRALEEEGIEYRQIDVRENGKSRYNLDTDLYVIIEAPIHGSLTAGRIDRMAARVAGELERKAAHLPPEANSLNEMSNQAAKNQVNKLLGKHTKGLFSDSSWEAVHFLWSVLDKAAIDWTMTGTQYRQDSQGRPTSKEWKLEVEFVNAKGRPTVLHGVVVASGAGSVEDPLDKYDLVAYVS